MAGIGFELRKLLRKDSLSGVLRAYAYAGIISAGPWILSILGMLLIGFLAATAGKPLRGVNHFQVSVTHMIAASLILTGIVQLAFTRYIADRIYEKKLTWVLPNFNGILLATTAVSGGFALVLIVFFFHDASPLFRLGLMAGFVTLCNIWIATIFLAGLKQYVAIVLLFALGYGTVVATTYFLRIFGGEGLLVGFVIGHVAILVGMYLLVLKNYPAETFVEFDAFGKRRMLPQLMLIGFVYNLGMWIDKYMFWYYPPTGERIVGPLHASIIYDLPAFLAHLVIIPGMAVFLVRMETDFAEYYERFFEAVRSGGSLEYIEEMRNEMVFVVREGLYEIMRVQIIATLVFFLIGERVLAWIGISTLYLPLLNITIVGTGLQVVFLGMLNVFFYLDMRTEVIKLVSVFLVANAGLTALSLKLGPAFYGYGFAAAVLLVVLYGFYLLSVKLDRLEYETFMLQ